MVSMTGTSGPGGPGGYVGERRTAVEDTTEDTTTAALEDLWARACALAVSSRADTYGGAEHRDQVEGIRAFLRAYYRHVAVEDMLERDPADVVGAAFSHRQLAARRPQGTTALRVFSPTLEEHGWSCAHTVVEVVADDMPFLVDSVSAELTRLGRGIHLVIHPQVRVRRDITGELLEVLSAGAEPTPDTVVESWMHLEVDRETDPAGLADISANLQRVLRDVRESVEDWPKMREAAIRLAAELGEAPPAGLEVSEVAEAQELLHWLAGDHFTFLGYREYVLDVVEGEDVLRAVPGTGLGILRSDQDVSASFAKLPPEVRARARQRRLLILTKANSRATVHRPSYLDYVGIKTFDADGAVTGERRFLGLFTSTAYTESVAHIPVVRRKVAEVLALSGFSSTSHSGKDIVEILETFPRDELFQVSVEQLYPTVMAVLHLAERRRLRLFLRRDEYARFISCLVYLPRDRYTTAVRERMMALLQDSFGAASVDYTARVTESVLARLHFVVRMPSGVQLPDVDPAELESRLTQVTRSWGDDFAEALVAQLGEERAAALGKVYGQAFPEAYKEDFPARIAVADLVQLEELSGEDIRMSFYEPVGAGAGERRFKLYRSAPVSLTAVLPVLQHLGVEVVDERPYAVDSLGGRTHWVYDFGLRYTPTPLTPDESVKPLFQEAFAAVWRGEAESDGLNALVLAAGLTWRQVAVVRAYAKYMRQAGTPFSQDYIQQCLLGNLAVTRGLVRLFEGRFDPTLAGDPQRRQELVDGLAEEVRAALDEVASLDQDRILRTVLSLIMATVRTNAFQLDPSGSPKGYLSFKLDPHQIPELPAPRPRHEIWVYSPRVEGVHLRFGAVARGGLRWSERREDFRTEILGLVKAQTVKNAVIVPTGAKGGFVVKRPPESGEREAVLAEGVACYQTLIRGLLDVTDNLVRVEGQNRIVPPPQVVRHDGEDTYLVVAADKGTATFSDIANAVAADYGFWLGDAFASGGSAGFDHKAMGITARGAWESVKRHFRELGVDIQTQPFSVVGIGDMSGDVFGNGMLLSEKIRLVAAFDHRHIFLDPDPDPALSYAERRRLFALPRSSWADYDASLISAGGGVFPRSAKSVPVSAQVRAALGLPDGVSRLAPAELMRAILLAPVDLFWNGGIGTYVKSSTQSHAEVGDKANDAIRVDGNQLRAKVVGEGGNLGLTQLGRIEYALAGGRVNTDAIDNSAGVDTSDHEVNIKILLDRVVADGDLTVKQRNQLLASMTDEVAALVLRDNYEQNVLLGNARGQTAVMLGVHRRLIHALEERGDLDRALEFLPSDAEMDARAAAGTGLTSPEFSVLVAYAKLSLTEVLLASDLPDQSWFHRALVGYFPPELAERFADRLAEHPLRREIITTSVVNDMVNRGGISFAFRAEEEVGASAAQITCAYTVARKVFGLGAFWAAVAEGDNKIPVPAQTAMYLEARRLLDRATRWLLQARRGLIDVEVEIDRFAAEVGALAPRVPELLCGREQERLAARTAKLTELGAPQELAVRTAALLDSFSLLDVVEIAGREQRPAGEVAALYYALSDHFAVDRFLTRISGLPRDDRWQVLARSALRYDLYAALSALTSEVLRLTPAEAGVQQRIAAWSELNAEALTRASRVLTEIDEGETSDLATLSVALRTFRAMVLASG